MAKSAAMMSVMVSLALCIALPLVACGVAETGAASAAIAASEAQQVKQGQQTQARVRQQLDAAYQQSADQRDAAEAQSR